MAITHIVYVNPHTGTLYTDREMEEMFDEFLDEFGPVDVGLVGLSYYPSVILKNTDPTAYRCGFHDWIGGMDEDDEDYYFEEVEVTTEQLLHGSLYDDDDDGE